MKIQKYRIYYYYSSYFRNSIEDIKNLSFQILKNDFANLILTSDNYVIRKNDEGKILKKELDYKKKPNQASAFIEFPNQLSEYQKIYIFEASSLKVNEEHLLTDIYRNSFYYIRCYLNKIIAETERIRFHIYPMLKIYKTGIFHLSFRIFSSPECEMKNVEDILEDVNLFKKKFNTIKIPVQLSRKCFFDNGYVSEKEISKAFEENLEDFNEEDEEFVNIDLRKFYKDEYFNLDFIKNYIFDLLEMVVNTGKKSKQFNILGNFWNGRPIVFLEEIEIKKKEKEHIIATILARNSIAKERINQYLEKNLRAFNDIGHYSNEGISLIINNEYDVHEFENMIYPRLILEEEILNMYLLYKQELERMEYAKNFQEIIDDRKFVMYLKEIFFTNTNFGEIKEFFDYILIKKLKLDEIINLLSEKIEIRIKEIEYHQGKKSNKYQEALTILFGLLGSSSIYEYIVKNIFNIDNLPSNIKIVFFLGTLLVVLILIWLFDKIWIKRE